MMIDSLEGRILNGRYQIQSLIRSGGMASVMVPKQTAGAFSSTLDQPAYMVQVKRNKSGWFILLALVILLGVVGLSGCQKFIAKGDPQPAAALTPVETNQIATMELTQTIPAETALSTVGLTTPAVQAAPPGTETAQPGLETALPGGEAAQSGTETAQPGVASTQLSEPPRPSGGTVSAPAVAPSLVPTERPALTPTPSVIGGADKIAYINGGDIWMANLDGSDLTQLTKNATQKTALRWLPDGQGLSYISGKCIHTISIFGVDSVITCFNYASYLKAFEVSPDGKQMAISLDNLLYLLPYDLERLKSAHTHANLTEMADCADLAPYKRNYGKDVRWSNDSKQWAALVMGVLKDGYRADIIEVFAVDRCIPNPLVKVQFPDPHFTYKNYDITRTIVNYDWDGVALFVLNDNKRNNGFGDLHIFNWVKYKPILSINPVDNVCCYRDARWSPDDSYLVFAFQDIRKGSHSTTKLYMIPYGDVGTGASFEPLPLPEISNPRESPQPVLRPAIRP